jgi:DNA replication and repair protein RecF
MYLEHLSLADFRNYAAVELSPAPAGVTLLHGANGAGKTNLLEAVGYLATLRSFRGSPKEAMVCSGAEQAIVRARAGREGRALLLEAELSLSGRDKLRLNRQPVRRQEDLVGALLVTVFSPDDVEVVKGPPQGRRQYMDDLLAALHPRHAVAQSDLERVLRQRNALLRSAAGTLRGPMATTLDVWDAKLAQLGEDIALARQQLAEGLQGEVDGAYRRLSGQERDGTEASQPAVLVLRYERSWSGRLAEALAAARPEDVRRGATTVGPQRDDLHLEVGGLAARTQASQGEQRSTALALRLGGHHLVAERQGTSPVLLLDDVFSELDPVRSASLAACLPAGQTLLTTAGPVPDRLVVAYRAQVAGGALSLAGGQPGPVKMGV